MPIVSGVNGFVLAMAFSCGVAIAAAGSVPPRKFIAHGWDALVVTPENILSNAAKFAAAGTDGVTVALPVRRQADGSLADYWNLPTDPEWQYETFADQVPVLRQIVAHPGLGESFLLCAFSPMRGRMGFRDDAKWKRFAGNMRVLARLACEGGMRGLFLDNEDYCARRQYVLAADEGGFDEAYDLARQRGREVFAGVFEEFPQAVILPFWLLTQVQSLLATVDPVAEMRNTGSLWPAFVNGILDVMPPTAVLVDGNEYAYQYEAAKGDFAASAADQMIGLLPLVVPENRAKYRSQVRVGFGLYLDMYVSDKENSSWYFGPVNGSRLEHFRINATEAARRADEYVWLYGEQVSHIRWEGLARQDLRFDPEVTWEDRLPGFAKACAMAKDPAAAALPTGQGVARDGLPALTMDASWDTSQRELFISPPSWREDAFDTLDSTPYSWDVREFFTEGGPRRMLILIR